MFGNIYDRINDYGSVKISLASPNDIRSWSFGEVRKPETINYRTYRPEKDGLFCERIFGPERDWECSCGKYKGTKYKGIICDRCGVKVTHSRVRRKRMGHINLAAPVEHIWFFKAIPNHTGTLLDMKTADLEKIIYFQDYVVVESGDSPLKPGQLLSEEEFRDASNKYGLSSGFKTLMGAEAIKALLAKLDLEELSTELRLSITQTKSKQKMTKLAKRLKLLEAIKNSTNKPEWMVLDVIPVIPPDLRPLVLLESGNFATSDLNDLYRRIINRNNRLKKLIDLNAPEVIIRNEKRMLQQAVDSLLDNSRCRRPVLGSNNRPLKSLTDMIKGKQGRFRENLLGKRVDYSARSVIVVGPNLKLYQCGLPKKIAMELYQPFIIRKLKEHGLADTIKSAKRMIERRDDQVWDVLEEVIHQHPVLLNRAPTLHRMGVQAFEPVLVEGNAIILHPLACKGFNADFDGDQMAVHLPLSIEAQAEAHTLMMTTNNVFSPANGAPMVGPSQDMVMGNYYLTYMEQWSGHELINLPGIGLTKKEIREKLGKKGADSDCAKWLETNWETLRKKYMVKDFGPTGGFAYKYVITQKKLTKDQLKSIETKLINSEHPKFNEDSGMSDNDIGALWTSEPYLENFYEECKGTIKSNKDWIEIIDLEEAKKDLPDKQGIYFFRSVKTNKVSDGYLGLATSLKNRLGFHFTAPFKAAKPDDCADNLLKTFATEELYNLSRRIPAFRDAFEAVMAYETGKIGLHARIKVQIDADRKVVREPETIEGKKYRTIETTVGRCIFNDILPPKAPFYNTLMNQKMLGRVISDCYEIAGSAETIDLLDKIKDLGFRQVTLAGLSFGIKDLKIPEKKQQIIDATEKKAHQIQKNYDAGVLTEGERHNQLIDAWTHARVAVTNEMMRGLKEDTTEEGKPYLNPIYLMTDSGARGSVDQIQQLAGMRALMAKPSGEIIETPIKANFREGLTVLEYFSSTHGARKGLADTALKTANSGYLTRKLIDVAQNLIISEYDCGTLQGITKSTVSRGAQVDVPLSQLVIGRTARDNIRNPITDEMIVCENEVITPEAAARIEALGLDAIRVRSPLSCDSPFGICAKCYGWDLSTNRIAEGGTAVGIIAAQSIGEPGTQLTLRTFHTGGVASRAILESEALSTIEGKVEFRDINPIEEPATFKDKDGNILVVGSIKRKEKEKAIKRPVQAGWIALKRNGEIAILDEKFRELDKFKVPYGAHVVVNDGQSVKKGQRLFWWDAHRTPILAEVGGGIRFVDIVEGETMRFEEERKGQIGKPVVIEHKGDKHPQIIVEDQEGKILDVHYLPAAARIEVEEGQSVQAGQLLAHLPRATAGTQDITGGLPRVTEVFEARKPKDPAAMAEISGRIELKSDKRKGKMTIIIRSESGMEKEHHVPRDRHLNVHAGDMVEAGDALTDGPLVPHDILRIKGEEALHKYLINEIQNVYRSQNVNINDKHIEIICAQMMRKVEIDSIGDSSFLPGEVVDKFVFQRENQTLAESIRISDPGDCPDLVKGQIIEKDNLASMNEKIEAIGGTPAKGRKPKPATAKTLLLGITKASLRSDSFIAAASFQETTKVLTGASLAGKIDRLCGLKENVILGHLIPAGTAFKPHLDIKVKHLAEPPVPKEFREAKEEQLAKKDAESKVKEMLGIN
jgi:DNA-directed RNA polymerase beta' subunit